VGPGLPRQLSTTPVGEREATSVTGRPLGVGVDLVSVARISAMARRYDDRLLRRVFTAGELRRSYEHVSRDLSLATCFGAKEAVAKALGCGLSEVDWPEIEVFPLDDRIGLSLHGAAADRAAVLGILAWAGRRTTNEGLVIVIVVAMG
jgi:holo-[acyl-carrier protein] synthase